MLFKDFIKKWFNEYKIFQLASNTINTYISRLNAHILPALGEYRLSELNTAIIQEFYNSLISEKNMKPSTAMKVMDIVIISLKYAKKNKLIYELPTDID